MNLCNNKGDDLASKIMMSMFISIFRNVYVSLMHKVKSICRYNGMVKLCDFVFYCTHSISTRISYSFSLAYYRLNSSAWRILSIRIAIRTIQHTYSICVFVVVVIVHLCSSSGTFAFFRVFFRISILLAVVIIKKVT